MAVARRFRSLRWWLAAVIVLCVSAATAGCGGPTKPAEFSNRTSLPKCGAVDSRDGVDDAEQVAIACLIDAHAAHQSGELVVTLNGTEGEDLVRYVRALVDGSGEVFYDNRRDPFRSTDWSYQGGCREIRATPFEIVAATDCSYSAPLS